jgi:HPt (histidine-containing phosphotransfer) domain-containing protein
MKLRTLFTLGCLALSTPLLSKDCRNAAKFEMVALCMQLSDTCREKVSAAIQEGVEEAVVELVDRAGEVAEEVEEAVSDCADTLDETRLTLWGLFMSSLREKKKKRLQAPRITSAEMLMGPPGSGCDIPMRCCPRY